MCHEARAGLLEGDIYIGEGGHQTSAVFFLYRHTAASHPTPRMIPSGDNRNNDIAAPSFSPTKESSSCISNEAMSPVCTASLSDASSSLPSSPTMNSLVASSLILEAQLNGTSDSCLAPSGRVLLTRDDSSIVSSRVRVRKVYGRLPKFW